MTSAKWDITNKCNLNCIHCSRAEYNKSKNDLNLVEVYRIIDYLKYNKINTIHFLGGEPFAREDFLDILEYCRYKGIYVQITTNGTLLDDYMIDKFVNYFNNLSIINFSLDGARELTNDKIRGQGSYRKCIENIKKLSAKNKKNNAIGLGINATLNKINKDDIDEYFKIAEKNQIKMIFFMILKECGNAIKNKQKLFLETKDIDTVSEKIFNNMSIYKEMKVGVPFGPNKINKLNNKYNTNVQLGNGLCNSHKWKIYINGTGNIYPCGEFYVIKDVIEKNIIGPKGIPKNVKLEDCEEVKKFNTYLEGKRKKIKEQINLTNCRFKDYCSICPITKRKIDDICNECNM